MSLRLTDLVIKVRFLLFPPLGLGYLAAECQLRSFANDPWLWLVFRRRLFKSVSPKGELLILLRQNK